MRCTPEAKRNEALGLIRQGLDDISISPHVDHLGRPGAVGPRPRLLRLVRRPHQLRHRRRLRHRPGAVRRLVAGGAPPHRQGHPALPLRVLAGACCMAAGIEPPPHDRRARLPAGRRREDVARRRSTRSSRPTSSPTFGVDGFRYHFLRDHAFGPDGDFSYEGMVARYNADLANNLGNLLSRVATVVGKQVRRHRPGAPPRQPPGRGGRPTVYDDGRGGVGRGRAQPRRSRPPGGWSARPTPHLEANEPWKAEPGPERRRRAGRRPRGAAHRRRPGQSRRCPAPAPEIWRRIGLPGAPSDQRLPGGRGLGRLPGRAAGREGRAALPPHRAVDRRDPGPTPRPSAGPTATATSPRRRGRRRPSSRGPRRPGVDPADHRRHRRRATSAAGHRRRPAATTGCGPPSACIPTTPAEGVGRHRRPARPSPTRWWSAWASAGSTTTTTTRPGPRSARRSPPRSRWPHDHDLALVIHTREAWDDTFDILGRRGRARAHGVPLLHRRPRRGPAGPRPGGDPPVLQRDRHLQDRRRRARGRGRSARSTGCWSRPTRPYLAPGAPPGPAEPPGAGRRSSGAAVAEAKGVAVAAVAEASLGRRPSGSTASAEPARHGASPDLDQRSTCVDGGVGPARRSWPACSRSRSRYGSCDRVTAVPSVVAVTGPGL